MDEKGVYQDDGDPIEDQLKIFFTKDDDESEDITYFDKGFEEIVVNFIGIDAS